MLRLENVSKKFNGTAAVTDINLDVKGGETCVLIGTSGCGKTTTLRLINRLIDADSGSIFINNQNIHDSEPHELRRKIGYVLQHHGLFPHYSVAENIAVVPRLLNWEDGKIIARSKELLAKLDLEPETVLRKMPHELSGGQQQRIGLARALIADAPLILMDEPFGALDEITRAGIRRLFIELDELKSKTVVMVTHDIGEAFELGDQICLMDKGRIVQRGTKLDLLNRPANAFVKSFIGSHHLELRLRSTLVSDIMPFLAETQFQPDINLWKVLQRTGAHEASLIMHALEQYNQQMNA